MRNPKADFITKDIETAPNYVYGIERNRERMFSRDGDSYYKSDVDGHACFKWASNDAVIPESVLRDAWVKINPMTGVTDESHERARKIQTSRQLSEYRKNRSGYSETQKAEMRNAFGDKPVVNAVTGESIDL